MDGNLWKDMARDEEKQNVKEMKGRTIKFSEIEARKEREIVEEIS